MSCGLCKRVLLVAKSLESIQAGLWEGFSGGPHCKDGEWPTFTLGGLTWDESASPSSSSALTAWLLITYPADGKPAIGTGSSLDSLNYFCEVLRWHPRSSRLFLCRVVELILPVSNS